MRLTEYIQAIKTFQPCSDWNYSPNACESKICCGDSFEHENHGMIKLRSGLDNREYWEPIVICDDCVYQIANKTYDMKLRRNSMPVIQTEDCPF